MADAAHAPRRVALTSHYADFWLLGGFSIAVWWIMRLLDPFRAPGAPTALAEFSRTNFGRLGAIAGITSIFVTYPHFMASYRLAYGRGRPFILGHWAVLIAVPLLLAATLGAGLVLYGTGSGDPAIDVVRRVFAFAGLQGPFASAASSGAAILAIGLQLMLLSVGWHYSKQAFGCIVVQAAYTGYPLAGGERTLIRWALHGIWLAAWLANNQSLESQSLHRVSYPGLGIPANVVFASELAAAALLIAMVVMILRKREVLHVLPSLTVVVPYVAFLVWWFPGIRQREFHDSLVPVFHAIQYAPFVWRMEAPGVSGRSDASRAARLALIFAGVVLAGTLLFELIPTELDTAFQTAAHSNAFIFVVGFAVFLNIHHYCMDSVLWKMKDARVRDALA